MDVGDKTSKESRIAMKKTISMILLAVLLLFFCVPNAHAEYEPKPHPDENSGNQADYVGTWIIDGKTDQDTNWVLEINEDGTYHLHNEYQDFEGNFRFVPGQEGGPGDTLIFEFDPSLGIQIVLENMANGLFDVSGQGLIFVRPGNKANVEEAEQLEDYSPDQMIGDWLFVSVTVIYHELGMNFDFTAEEIIGGMESETGDTQLVLNLGKNVVNYVSPRLGKRFPITKLFWHGPSTFSFDNAQDDGYFDKIIGIIHGKGQNMMFMASPGHPEATALFYFDRVTGYSIPEENEGGE